MPKIRLGDLLQLFDETENVKIKGFYNHMTYGMEDVSDNYLKRYVLDIKSSTDNYEPVTELYFEDEID